MHRRYDKRNIPTELLRSFLTIQEQGSFTKAAFALDLTQPAISAQIKRLQHLVGGDVFSREGLGLTLTEKGEAVTRYARRILDLNDQLLSLAGAKPCARYLRIGLPSIYADRLLPEIVRLGSQREGGEHIQFCCEASFLLSKSLEGGYLDIAFIVSTPPQGAQRLAAWSEPMVWICARDFLLSPGAPIPVLSWPHSMSDQMAFDAMQSNGLQFNVAFVSADFSAQLAALRAGLGFFAMPERMVPPDLKVARDYFLPRLPDLSAGLYLREGLDGRRLGPLVERLDRALNPMRARAESPVRPAEDAPEQKPVNRAMLLRAKTA